MNFLQWIQLISRLPQILSLVEKILELLNPKGKDIVAKTIADKINKAGEA